MEAVVGNSVPSVPRGSEPCRGLLEVAPFVTEGMQLCDVKALRVTCREGRAVADARISALALDYVQQDVQLPETTRGTGGRRGAAEGIRTVREFTTFVRGILSRGARPTALTLHPIMVGERRDGPENENVALTVLAAFSTFQLVAAGPVLRARRPAPSLTHLSLCNIPYTDALASAVHAAAPHLSSLTIASDLSSQAALAAATPGLDRLITTCAPSLTSLTFSRPLHSFPWPLADAIAACTRLQHLQLSLAYTVEKDGELYGEAYESEFDSAERIAETASALPALRSFDFEQCNPRIIVAYGLLGLTRLTSLRVNGLDRETMEYFVRNALRPLSNLVRLTLHGDAQIDEDDLRLLAAGCGQLMSLTFEDSFWLEIQGGAGQQQGGGRRRNCIPLPAALRELHLGFRIEPWALLALQLPPGLTRLTAADLRASFDDQRCNQVYGPAGRRDAAGGGHHVGPAVGAGGHGGLQPLASPCPGFDDLLEAVQLLCEHGGGGQRELTLWHDGDYYSPRAWPEAGNGHVRLFAALRPLRLRKLLIGNCCALGLEDVMALAEQLPEVEDLAFQCQLHPAAVPLLARLPRLRHLTLHVPWGRGTEDWFSSSAVAAALMPLLLGNPGLKRVFVVPECGTEYCDFLEREELAHECMPLLEGIWGGVRWLRAQLRRLGRDPLVFNMGTWSHTDDDKGSYTVRGRGSEGVPWHRGMTWGRWAVLAQL